MPQKINNSQPQPETKKAEEMLIEANRKIEAEQFIAREKVASHLQDAERRALGMIEEAKKRAMEEGNKIIEAARVEAEAQAIKGGIDYGGTRVQRMIVFPPELKQAGISILSYFSEVLSQRYPGQEMAVRIEQFGTKVRLTVDGPSGWRDTIEHDLETYGRVVVGQIPASSIVENEIDILRLENKLQVARIELDFEKRVNQLSQSHADGRIRSLESQVERLFLVLDQSLSQPSSVKNLLEALQKLDANNKFKEPLRTLQIQVLRQASDIDAKATKEALATIKRDDPSMLNSLYELLSSTASGTAGNLLATWIQSLIK